MFGLVLMTLFAVTGLTIHYEEWFGATTPRVQEYRGTVPAGALGGPDATGEVDRLAVVEAVRQQFRISAALAGIEVADDRVTLGFKSPGEVWEVEIERPDGAAIAQLEMFNAVAVLNNLHRGRYSGPWWGLMIDLSGVLIVLACLTGLVLWVVLPKRRTVGLAAVASGLIVVIVFYVALVPGPDAKVLREPQPKPANTGG